MFLLMKNKFLISHACKLHAWVVPIVIFVLCSCSNDVNIISDFPINQKLKGHHIKALDSLYNAYSIMKLDDKYILTLKSKDNFLCVCDKDFHVMKKCLKRGHGSREWIAPLVTGQCTYIKGEIYAYVLERGANKLFAVNFNSRSDDPIEIENFYKERLYGINYVYRTEEKKYIGSKLVELAELFTYDAKSGISHLIQLPSMDPSLFSANKFELSQTIASYSHAQRKLAVAYFSFSPHSYVVDICSTKDYIYILYNNPSLKQRMNILVIRWSGTAVARYDVPRLTCFTVDEDNQRFIGILEDDTNGVGFEFKYKL